MKSLKDFFGVLKQRYDPYLGLHPNSIKAGKIRAKQTASLAKLTPSMMFVNIICALAACFAFVNQQHWLFMALWTLMICGFAYLGISTSVKNQTMSPKVIVSKNVLIKAAIWAATLSGIWAVLPVYMYPRLPIEKQVIMIAILSGMMGGGAITLYVVPRAMLLWLGTITGGCAIALILQGNYESYIVLVLIAVYVTALAKAGLTMAQTFLQGEKTNLENEEQADTIGLLLRDFSGKKGDWLWEINAQGQFIKGQDDFFHAFGTAFPSVNLIEIEKHTAANSGVVINLRSLKPLSKHFEMQTSFRDIVVMAEGEENTFWVQLAGKPIYNTYKEFSGFRGVASDVTETKIAEERIAYLAHNDALTGLINRGRFTNALESMIKSHNPGSTWSILYLDLDGFKAVNDSDGHAAGDDLLIEVASRLKKCISDNDLVARLGGDEFAILCNSAETVQSISELAQKLIDKISKPYIVNGNTIEIGTSIGIALGDLNGTDSRTLMKNADLALYRAKSEGKGTYRLYNLEMDEIIQERRSLENDVRVALRKKEFSVNYQPLVSAETGKTTGFEALIRWYHPDRGAISPTEFIPIAERLGVIHEIGEWVLDIACKAATNWPDHLSVSVNLSPEQFKNNRIISNVTSALLNSKLDPKRLELEITEGLFIENTDQALSLLHELKTMGVSLAMDDFGTGYSSLSNILKFPFDKLKIDRSLISSIDDDKVARNLLEAIMKLGSVLELKVTAEGVETNAQAELLKTMDCTHLQGFHFGKPLSESELSAYMLNEFAEDISQEIAKPDTETIVNSLGK